MKVMHISIAIDLPADEWDEAAAKIAIKPVYDVFVRSLADAGIAYRGVIDTVETRAKPVAANGGAKRGRKPKRPVAEGAVVSDVGLPLVAPSAPT